MNPAKNTTRLSAVVVDDERLARRDLISMLSAHPDVTVLGQADDVPSAASLIARLKPDVVFLDIRMPGESGFDLLGRVDPGPRIVFVTAYDEYAIRAFEVNALDYLMKPVTTERLALCIERLTSPGKGRARRAGGLRRDDSLFMKIDGAMKFLRVDSIAAIKAAGDYTQVITTGGATGLTDKRMSEWEARLPASTFCRIHRSVIVNLTLVERVESAGESSRKVYLKGLKMPVDMSRRYFSRLRHMLK